MGRSVEDVQLGCEVLYGYAHAQIPIPFRSELAQVESGRTLKIGYYLSGEVCSYVGGSSIK